MQKLKKSPMEKVGAIVNYTVIESTKKNTKKKNSNLKPKSIILKKNGESDLKDESKDAYRKTLKEITFKMIRLDVQLVKSTNMISDVLIKCREQLNDKDVCIKLMGQVHELQKLYYSQTREYLKLGCEYIEVVSQLEISEEAKVLFERIIVGLSKHLKCYQDVSSNEEFLTLVNSTKSEIFEKIQNAFNPKMQDSSKF
jgi:hypothetical protein